MYYYQIITAHDVAMEKSDTPYETKEGAIAAGKDSLSGMSVENWPVDIRVFNGPPGDFQAYIVTFITLYQSDMQQYISSEKVCEVAIYPAYIMEKVRQRLGLESWDTKSDSEINAMSHDTVFTHCLAWEGIIGYEYQIRDWVSVIYGVTLE